MEAEGTTQEVLHRKKQLTSCMRDHLKASSEVQVALREVDSWMKKKQTKMIFMLVKVFIGCLLLPITLLLLDVLPDIMFVDS